MERVPASQRVQRLKEIAREVGAVLDIVLTPLSPPRSAPFFCTPEDQGSADEILRKLRNEEARGQPQSKGLKRAFTKSQPSKYTYADLYAALSAVVEENGSAGVGQALLERFKTVGGDINIARRPSAGMMSRMRKSELPAEPGRLLQRSSEIGRHDFVQLLAPLATQESLDESLQIVLASRDLPIMMTLLQYGE
jgi:hypothetical protein